MPKRILSLDIQTNKDGTLDIASMMPLSDLHVMRNHLGGFVEEFHIRTWDADIFLPPVIQIERCNDTRFSDLVLPTKNIRHIGARRRRRYLNLVKPLYVPYGSLDVRQETVISSQKKYVDIFTRPLSRSLMVRRRAKMVKRFLKKNRKGIIGTIAMTFLFVVPVLWYVKISVQDGYLRLLSLPKAQNIAEAQQIVQGARMDFERANFLFLPFSWIPLETVDLAHRVSMGWLSLTRSAESILSLVPTWTGTITQETKKSASIAPAFRADAKDFFPLARFGIDFPTTWAKEHETVLSASIHNLSHAAEIYAWIQWDTTLPTKIRRVGTSLSKLTGYLSWYLENKQQVLTMFGDDNPVRYVIFNQNRDEIRANGWFPGTVISLSLYKGNILDYRQDDVYYYDWNLYPYKETPPPGLVLLSDNYGLRDVNYYPDFRETVEKANSFIERSGDSTITTGIAIHQGIIEDILKEIGPVSVSGVTIPFDGKNFSALMSTLVESEYGRELHAKDILFDFIHAFVAKIDATKRYDVVFDVIEKYWNNGEILIASRDDETEKFLKEFKKPLPWECREVGSNETISSEPNLSNITPQTASCTQNWVYPIFTSVWWNKSDRYIKRTYAATVKKAQGCTYENTITISNLHAFSAYDKQDIKSFIKASQINNAELEKKIDYIQGNSPNKSYVRLYVPKTAKLLGDGGSIEVNTGSLNATVFSFFLNTPVGGTATKTIHYTVEIPQCADYSGSIDWYRQPGLRQIEMK